VTRIWTAWLLLQGLPEEVALDSLSQTECDAILNKDPTSNLLTESEQLAFAGSFSSHAAIQLIESYGLDEAAQLVLASNQRAPIVIRVNTLRFTTEEVMTGLKQQGIEATPSSYIDGCLIIQGRGNLRGTTLFRDGAFEFQDEASQLLIKAVPTTSERVIDYCAGAGGKTLHIASALPKNSQIIACDIRPTALKELQKRLKRNQLRRVRTHLLSKSQPQGLADCVLVDAPCSGSGILRRHAHNRHNMTEEKLVEITDLQSVLLGEAASLVAPGGTLIYATCSLLKSENEDQVHRFLEHHQGFSVVSIQDWWPEGSAQGLGHDSFLRVNPHQHHMDGFFLAKLVKKA
jgi:16S rRNA (cytosine967-C5)-methyltransferase